MGLTNDLVKAALVTLGAQPWTRLIEKLIEILVANGSLRVIFSHKSKFYTSSFVITWSFYDRYFFTDVHNFFLISFWSVESKTQNVHKFSVNMN